MNKFENDIVTGEFITNHIEEIMYTKYNHETWSEYVEKATLSGYELRLQDAGKNPGLESHWIFTGVYDKSHCEALAKEIRKYLANSQLHQDFEKVKIVVTANPCEENGQEPDSTPYISIYINASVPKPSFKFKHNLTNLKDLSSFENFDRDSFLQKVEPSPTEMLLNAIRERDKKIAAEEARKKAEEEKELARQKAEEERIRLENEKNLQEFELIKQFVNEIGDFEVKVPSEDGTFTYVPIRQVISFETCSSVDGMTANYLVNFGYHMIPLRLSFTIRNGYEGLWQTKKIIIDWAVQYGVREPKKVLAHY